MDHPTHYDNIHPQCHQTPPRVRTVNRPIDVFLILHVEYTGYAYATILADRGIITRKTRPV